MSLEKAIVSYAHVKAKLRKHKQAKSEIKKCVLKDEACFRINHLKKLQKNISILNKYFRKCPFYSCFEMSVKCFLQRNISLIR